MKTINVKLLFLVISLFLLIYNVDEAYSRYVSDVSGDVAFNFAKWQILVNNENITTNYESKLKFTPIIDENENMASNVLGPTSTGYFDVEINPESVDTSFVYNINITIPSDSDIKNVVITDYAITNEEEIALGTEPTKIPMNGSNSISETMIWDSSVDGFCFHKFIVRVYFAWNDNKENMSDLEDTIIGVEAAEGKEINFSLLASLKFRQYVE